MANEPLIVEAVYSFKGNNNDELCFKKGDLITITQQEDGGWWEGTLNDKTGWFPSNYVKECKVQTAVQQSQYKGVVLKDLIDSEKAHVTELEGLVTNFLQPLEKSNILTSDEYKQLTGNIEEVLENQQKLLGLIEAESLKTGNDQRVGRLFLTWAPKIKKIHQTYCSLHPRAVLILDKYKEELAKYMESKGAASPGVLVLTTMLSKPFRRLEKYSGMLQELERHVEECHPDRGDTQRSVAVYKEIATKCLAVRRQKELELQVLTGQVRGWEGPSLTTLGEIICMGSVALGPQHNDRYFVLFPTTLLILSVSHRLSAFIYEGKLFLSGLTVNRLEDNAQYKNAFEITGAMIDRRLAVCQSKEEADHWVDLLRKSMPRSSTTSLNQKVAPSQAQYVPQPPPHQLNLRGYSNRSSVISFRVELNYKPTNPPENYPPTAPFAGLTKYFHKLIKEKIITQRLLRQLLYSEYLNKMNLNLVRIRHHKSECVIVTKSYHLRDSIINCDSDSDTDSDSSDSDSSDDGNIKRQNAVDLDSDSEDSSDNPFGYIRYYNPRTGLEREEKKYESFVDYGEPFVAKPGALVILEDEPKKKSIVVTSTATLKLTKQDSESSNASSFVTSKPNLACIDIPNLDDNTEMSVLSVPQNYIPNARQSCPTKFVGNKFNESSLTTIYIPSWSNSDNNISCQTKFEVHSNSSSTTHSSSLELPVNTLPLPDNIVAELLYNIDGEFNQSESLDSDVTEHSSRTVIKPPKMFENNTLSLDIKHIGFRKHSINSDKPRRRSSIQINPQDFSEEVCRCCMDNYSPRSSDSGMAGSCTLNSPDLAGCSMQQRCSMDNMSNLFHKFSDLPPFSGDACRNVISLSEIEARDFESECQCTSPFDSTPRTFCQPYVSENVFTGSRESLRTSVTSSIDILPKIHSSEIKLEPIPDPECVERWEQGDNSSSGSRCSEEKTYDDNPPVYKSGLYAHWWLKAKIPNSVLRGIYQDTRSPTTDVSTTRSSGDNIPDKQPHRKH
ncbi:unnamed protein product [Brassicogethes aeneus]|uniref:Rho guanine nucleotide exchange factor 7 n=1 Tax=Brassicogethes aeneus TaxID=1431903 RepID=A0A9P0FGY9_BRAAE|nr:unnamed protein product [Brassicogethes aeneus]